jgi:hypothetical protein
VLLELPQDITEEGLPNALKKSLGLDPDTEISIWRFSKSAHTYVKMDGKEQYAAIVRGLRVKRTFTFAVKLPEENEKAELSDRSSGHNPRNERRERHESRRRRREELREERREHKREHRAERKEQKEHHKVEGIVERLRNDRFFREMVESFVNVALENRQPENGNGGDIGDNDTSGVTPQLSQAPVTIPVATTVNSVPVPAPYVTTTSNAVCDYCDCDITGTRYKCMRCADFDLCETCLIGQVHPSCTFIPLPSQVTVIKAPPGGNPTPTHHAPPAYHPPISLKFVCDGPLCREAQREITGTIYECDKCADTHFCSNCKFLVNWKHSADHSLDVGYSALPSLRFENGRYLLSLMNTGVNTWPKMGKLRTEPAVEMEYDWTSPFDIRSGEVITFEVAPDVVKRVNKWIMEFDNSESFEVAKLNFAELFGKDKEVEVEPSDIVPEQTSSLAAIASELVDYRSCGTMEYLFTFKNTGTVNWPEGLHVVEALLDGPRVKQSTENSLEIEPGTSVSFFVDFETSGNGTIMLISKTGRVFAREHVVVGNGQATDPFHETTTTATLPDGHVKEPTSDSPASFGSAASSQSLDRSQVKFPTLLKESPPSSVLETSLDLNLSEISRHPDQRHNSTPSLHSIPRPSTPLTKDSSDSSLSELETATEEAPHSDDHHASDLETLSDLGTMESAPFSEDEYDVLTSSDLNN